MEDVRCDRAIDVYVGEVLPKRVENWLNPSFGTGLQKISGIMFKPIESLKDTVKIMQTKILISDVVTYFVSRCGACSTLSCWYACSKNLLRVVARKACQKWVASTHQTITACHKNSSCPSYF